MNLIKLHFNALHSIEYVFLLSHFLSPSLSLSYLLLLLMLFGSHTLYDLKDICYNKSFPYLEKVMLPVFSSVEYGVHVNFNISVCCCIRNLRLCNLPPHKRSSLQGRNDRFGFQSFTENKKAHQKCIENYVFVYGIPNHTIQCYLDMCSLPKTAIHAVSFQLTCN